MDRRFEWDPAKAAANLRDHDYTFEEAAIAWKESFRRGKRQNMSEKIITARMRTDGQVVEVLEDGSERPFPERPPSREMTDEEVEAAALADPDCPPMTEADLARMKPVPRAKTLRRALSLTQEEFAARYHIPVGTLRDWEQGRTEPDQPARAYLRVIAVDPEGIRRALQAGPRAPVES